MATDLVMKVKADVKDASKALKDLGYNVEQVEAKTKKAKEQQDLWHKAMEKGSKDNIKHLVEMGARIVSFTALTTAAYKGIKSCVDEALKQNEEAKKKIDNINSLWTNIKANLGKGLLDTVTPALDKIYDKLKEISDWADRKTAQLTIMDSLKEKGMTGKKLYDMYGAETVAAAYEGWYGKPGLTPAMWSILNDANNYAIRPNLEDMYNQAKNGPTIVDNTGVKYNPQARPGSPGYVDPWAGIHEAEARFAEVTAAEAAERARLEAFYNHGVGYTAQARPGAGRATGDLSALYDAEARNAELEAEKAHLEEMRELRKSYYADIRSMGMQSISTLTGAYTQSLENQMRAVEQSSLAEEEKNRKMNELAEKQFDAERLNSAASVAMSTAESIMNIWSKYGSKPGYAAVLTGLVGATSAVQLSTIASQQYTPFAQGGIVSGPTRAIIGEGSEKEAIMPLSKLREFVQPQEGGTISITVNVSSDGRGKEEIADAVFYAIERAQRTGALPRWRYAS